MYSIETKNLTKKFKDKIAVNEVDLQIKQGELFALLGTNGAGKTTTIKMLSGLILPTSGSIKIENKDMKKDTLKIKEILKKHSPT
jgi:ABC-type multidrug transport system ATPase subunit